ncbi:hypothetical protein TOPH_00955 [Tolypocladium ophioglossoides CBS 100239]|uniref:Tetraspanin Tsp3 n=1 Tax=Tolypocladium ophioglossoides (strain CBS 100239) TaxID=1163406 RepID=A0A0L0NK31_TOLOC|nr:hypothetical protein TOPH_00955 [Tolypocladium ophioglossoides CBS 100239]
MLNPGVVYMLTSVVLFAVAVVVHFHTSHLSLPLCSVVTALAVILPIAAFVNAYVYPNLLRTSHACADDAPTTTLPARLAPVILQGLQAVATAVLAALLLQGVVPSPALDFRLEHQWDTLFAARDGRSMRLVQDTYRCCGLDALHDRAYPFGAAESCADLYRRTEPCMAPWRSAMQATSAVDFGVVLAVGLMQILGLLMMRERTAWWTALRTQGWKQGEPADEETGARQQATPNGYGAVRAVETGPRAAADWNTSNYQ